MRGWARASRANELQLFPSRRRAASENYPGSDSSTPPQKIPPEKVITELAEAGYRLVKREDGLPYRYLLLLEPQ